MIYGAIRAADNKRYLVGLDACLSVSSVYSVYNTLTTPALVLVPGSERFKILVSTRAVS